MIEAKASQHYRVLHTADWHLGKVLGEHTRETEHALFLEFLRQAIQEHQVDTLVIAGDVFDSANPPQSALTQYYDFLSALYRDTNCSVVVVGGNHDSPGNLEAPRQVLKSLRTHVVGARAEELTELVLRLPSAENPKLIIAALPFLRDRDLRVGQSGQTAAEIQQELAKGIRACYQEAADTARNAAGGAVPIMATGHLTVKGCKASESERDIHIGGLGAVTADVFPPEFSYVALGHLHRPQTAGFDHVRYSGSPIALSFSEAKDKKELRLLDFGSHGLERQQSLSIPVFRQLAQLQTRPENLLSALTSFTPQPGDLPPWVEVVVEDPVPGDNLYDLAQKHSAGRGYEVIRVVAKRSAELTGTGGAETDPTENLDQVLTNPRQVFELRLTQEPGLTEDEKESLRLAFAELCEIQSRRAAEPGEATLGGRS